jgi:transposase
MVEGQHEPDYNAVPSHVVGLFVASLEVAMSLKPAAIPPVPAMTVQVAHAAFPKGNLYLTLRDELGVIFADDDFVHLYPEVGQPSLPPWQLALVTVMQFRENLSDRQAAEAVRARIDWKYLLGLELTDAGFDFSVLSEFRARLLVRGSETLLLDKLLGRCREMGLVKARGKQRTDVTRVLAAIRTLNRLELVAETLRAALNVLATEAPAWLQSVAPTNGTSAMGDASKMIACRKSQPSAMPMAVWSAKMATISWISSKRQTPRLT